jgi:hypothetical protein
MSEEMNNDGQQNAMILGEMRGQLREVVHSMNNLSMKFDGLTREVVALSALATAVGRLEAVIEAVELRLKTVEAQRPSAGRSSSRRRWAGSSSPR